MKTQFFRLWPFLVLFSLSPCMGATVDERREMMHVDGVVRQESRLNADTREAKRQFKPRSLWRRLSHAEQEALRQQMREVWQRMVPEAHQHALVFIEHPEERGAREARANKDDKHYRMRGDDERSRGNKEDGAKHRVYRESLSVEQRTALRENLRAHLRETQRRRCQNPPNQNVQGRVQYVGIDCGKAINH